MMWSGLCPMVCVSYSVGCVLWCGGGLCPMGCLLYGVEWAVSYGTVWVWAVSCGVWVACVLWCVGGLCPMIWGWPVSHGMHMSQWVLSCVLCCVRGWVVSLHLYVCIAQKISDSYINHLLQEWQVFKTVDQEAAV